LPDFLCRNRYYFFQVASRCTHEAEWIPFHTRYFSENLVAPEIEPGTYVSVVKNSGHQTTEAVGVDVYLILINYVSPHISSHAYVKLAFLPFEALPALTSTTFASFPQSISVWYLAVLRINCGYEGSESRPGKVKNFHFHLIVQPGSGVHPTSYLMDVAGD
jgi:hypothetical protein